MSADNTMVIQRRRIGWCAWMALGENLELRPGHVPMAFKSEIGAFHWAQEVCHNEVVEYGIVVLPPQPQEKRNRK